jgi:hypothetical protein
MKSAVLFLSLALKFVVFQTSTGDPILARNQADAVVRGVNAIWNQCQVAFQLENFVSVQPSEFDIPFSIANFSDLTDVRKAFGDDHTILVATTGAWDRKGSLGSTTANAWTSMPGSKPYGAVFERPVETNVNLISHELGHYLNLSHVHDELDLMNPVVYSRSVALTPSQCAAARSTVLQYWQNMLRTG